MLEVFDLQRRKTAILQNAYDIIETKEINAVYSLQFTLPDDDAKNTYCKPLHYVRYNKGELYRIIAPARTIEATGSKTYQCEHVIATLIDDVLFGDHIIGNLGTYTADCINYILARQEVKRWVLDTCDFKRQYEYAWQNENLLAALFSIPNLFTLPYMWTYDTSTYPWKLSLKLIDETATPQFYIRAKKNLLSFKEEKTAEQLCTRLYCLGYGEGINQLTISDVNNGVPYLLASQDKINEYGLITRIFVDQRFEDAASLKARGQAILEELQEPTSAKTFEVADLYELTDDELDHAEIGKIAKLTEDGTKTYITAITKNHSIAGDMQITLATKATDVASSIADLADRQRIEEVYSQGATQIYAQSVQANATKDVKAKLNFYIPSEMRIVNAVKVKINLSAFRSYSQATSGGGSTTVTSSAGGSTSVTSSSGGGVNATSSSGGGVTATSSAGGSTSVTSSSGGSTTATSSSGGSTTKTSSATTLTSSNTVTDLTDDGGTGGANHNHGIARNTKLAVTSNGTTISGYVAWVPSGKHTHPGHTHSVSIGSHTHSVSIGSHTHTVSIGSHTHTVSISAHTHTVSISAHTHTVSISAHTHSITIPDHTHGITQGIFTFGNPTAASLYVDGEYRAEVERDTETDITAYLTGSDGKIARGSWHSIEILPNELAYVTIDMMIQGFIQSRGGTTV